MKYYVKLVTNNIKEGLAVSGAKPQLTLLVAPLFTYHFHVVKEVCLCRWSHC